jgi:predicted nucleotidyltransferase
MEAWRPAAERNADERRPLLAEARRCAAVLASPGASRVILFGSLARDEAGPVSDIDLVVVIAIDAPFVERAARLAEIIDTGPRYPSGVPFDVRPSEV